MMSAQLQQSPAQQTPEAVPPPAAAAAAHSPMANRAAESKSPFIRSHADTLVSWQLLDDDAVARAKRENKLIFLTIGYFASHYCQLAKQDSFSHPTIASILNESFVPVIVDRDQRPDIDSIYMNYNHSLNSGGGWPLNVFLTPELEPVFGGTYWTGPEVQHRSDVEGGEEPLEFLTILKKLQSVWPAEESRVRGEAKQATADLRRFCGEGTLGTERRPAQPSAAENRATGGELYGEVDLDQIEEAYTHIAGTFDPMFGGFGYGAKFPTTAKLSFLLRASRFPKAVQDVVGETDCAFITTMALHTLRRMVSGGMYDHIGGGFHRHSVTRDWSLPSFEKTIVDNSLLLGLYLDAWLNLGGQKDSEFVNVVREIADYITSDRIQLPGGGFVTGEASDSYNKKGDKVMKPGAFYLWTRREFDAAVANEQESRVAAAYYDIREHGNIEKQDDPHDEFLNQNVLHVIRSHARLSNQFSLPEEEVARLIRSAKEKLTAFRQSERIRPSLDSKIITSYNAMAIATLARSSASLACAGDEERSRRCIEAARKAVEFIRRELWDSSSKTLYRMYSDARADTKGFAEDYAFLIEALLELYEVTAEESWLEWADELQAQQISLFYDDPASATAAHASSRCGAFYSTEALAPHTLIRIKDAMDASQPSVNAVSASNLYRLGSLLHDDRYTYLAKESVNAFGVEMLEHHHLFPGLLCGIVTWKLGGKEWIAVKDTPHGSPLMRQYQSAPRANLFTVRYHDPDATTTWLNRRDQRKDLPTEAGVYVVQNGAYEKVDVNETLKISQIVVGGLV